MLSRFGRGRILRSIVAATGAAALLATSACTIDGDNDTDTDTTPAAQAEDSDSDADDAVELTTNVEDDDTDVKVDEPIIVQDSEGIDSVSLTDGMGTEVEGSFNDDETEWTSDGKLDYSTTYSLEATGGDESL